LFAKGDLMLVKAAPHHYNEMKIAEMESRGPAWLQYI
jgi:hypothetical protein